MKLIKLKKDKKADIIIDLKDGTKELIGTCNVNDIMLFLDEKSEFYDCDDLNKEGSLYSILHHKFGKCWLWADKEMIKWIG